jgi:ferredoxin
MFDTFKRQADPDGRKKLQCNECRRQTIHTLEALCVGSWAEEHRQNSINGWTNFALYRCGACDEVCYEKAAFFSEQYDHDWEGNIFLVPDEIQYPAPASADFAFDTDFTPTDLNELIEEMLYALSGSKLRLATVALRMVVEFIVNDTKCAGKTLQKKIDDLHAKEHVDEAQLALLHKIRTKGNAGAHELIAMTRNEMVAGIGIVNLLLEKLYNRPARHAEVIKKANQAFKEESALPDASS